MKFLQTLLLALAAIIALTATTASAQSNGTVTCASSYAQCGSACYPPCTPIVSAANRTYYYTCTNGQLSTSNSTKPSSCPAAGSYTLTNNTVTCAANYTLCGAKACYQPCTVQHQIVNGNVTDFYYSCVNGTLNNTAYLPASCSASSSTGSAQSLFAHFRFPRKFGGLYKQL